MADLHTCPFCNTLLPAAVGGIRGTCPRCGETRVSSIHDGELKSTASSSMSQATAETRPPGLLRWPVYAAGLAVLAIGLVLAWPYLSNLGRSRTSEGPDDETHVVIAPADMPGLGYLPGSAEAILTIQMPSLLDKLGPEYRNDPAKALFDLGVPQNVIETIDRASGVGLRNVDQLVVGMGFEKGSFPPQIVIVVHTRQPYDMSALARDSDARALKSQGRTIYAVKASPVPTVYWWGPNDRVLVATLLPRDFADVPVLPRAGVDHLKPEMVRLIRDQIATDASAWLVASSDRWADHLRPYVLLPFTPLQGRRDLLAPSERLRSMSLSIPQSPDRAVDVQIELKSAAAADEIRTTLADRFRDEPVDVGGDGEICRIQTPFDPERVGSLVARLVGPAR